MEIVIPDFDSDIPAPAFGQAAHKREHSNPDPHFGFPDSSNRASSRPFGGTSNHALPRSFAPAALGGLGSMPSPTSDANGMGGPIGYDMRRKESVASSASSHPTAVSMSTSNSLASSTGPGNYHGRKGSIATPQRSFHRTASSDVFGSNAAPPIPSGLAGLRSRSNTGVSTIGAGADGHAPLEVAVYLVMDRFLEECETKISQILGRPIPASADEDIYIPSYLGAGVDPSFDGVFDSLAQVSKKDPRVVINHVMRWKSRQGEGIDEAAIQRAVASSGNTANARRVAQALSERKSIALVYLLCRALITIVQGVTRELLSEELGKRLEDIVFNSIKNADPYVTARNPNKQANMTMFAQLLGVLSNIRFTSVSDRFTAEIDLMNRSAVNRDQKDTEARLGYVIKGVQYLKLKIYPLEAFEDTADFIAAFASIFDASRGSFVKTAMAETLGPLLAQVAETATAEVNHPVWNRAINLIFAKAHSMSDKPSKARYWNATVPLLCACVGAAPQDFLVARWNETVDWCFVRLKDKATRHVMMLGIAQLVWSYLHRVKEGASALAKRLDPILRSAFPPDRKNAYPSDVPLDIFASMLHYILHWQLDYGSDFVLRTLLGGSSDAADAQLGLVAQAGPDRAMIAIAASTRALTSLAKNDAPPYPSAEARSSESRNAQREDGSDGDALELDFLEKPRIKAFVDAMGSRVLQLAAHCDRALAAFTLSDDRLVSVWHDGVSQRPESVETMVLRRHGAFAVEYPRDRQQYFDVLQSCLQAWPRLLQSSAAESAALDILFRGLLSLDVGVAAESKFCIRRFLSPGKCFAVLQAFTRFIGRPELTFRLKASLQKASDIKLEALVKLWVEGMTTWSEQLRKDAAEGRVGVLYADGVRLAGAMEATSLVLVCSRSASVRRLALDALRTIATLRTLLNESEPGTPAIGEGVSVASLLDEAEAAFFDNVTGDDLATPEKARLTKWRKQRRGEALVRLLESDNVADATLFYNALASVFSTALIHAPGIITHVRSLLLGALQRVYPGAAEAAGLSRTTANSGTPLYGGEDRNLLLSWTSLLISLVSVTTSSASKVGTISLGINSSTSTAAATRDRAAPGDELIKTVVPFLTSDQVSYREAAVRSLSCVHVSMYQGLLEGLAGLAQHLTGERKMAEAQKGGVVKTNPRVARLFNAIGKLHENTTRFLSHPDFNSTERTIEILLRFIKETCLFLRARPSAEDSSFVAIRKSFCIFCERVLVRLAVTGEVHRFFHADLLVDMFSLAEEWTLRTAGPDSPALRQPQSRNASISSSARAVPMKTRSSSTTSLMDGAIDIKPSSSSGSRRQEGSTSRARPIVSANRVLRWATAIFERAEQKTHAQARRALLGAARSSSDPEGLIEAALTRCWNEPELLSLPQTLFGVISGALITDTGLEIRPAAITVIAIARIAHFDLASRQRALDLLSSRVLSEEFAKWVPDIEAGIQSTFAGQHLVAQYQLCAAISQLRPSDAWDTVAELANRIVQMEPHRSRFLARLLPLWMTRIDLGPTVADISSPRVRDLLTGVLLISSRLGDTQPDEIRSVWSSLASSAHPLNGAAVITFLLEETTRRANPAFVRLARIILTCVAESSGAEAVVGDLLASIHPAALLSTTDDAPPSPEATFGASRVTDLESFYPQLPSRTVLSPMQAAILLLGEAMVLRPSALGDRLPILLHAYVVQADHTNTILRAQMREALVRYVGMLRRMGNRLVEPDRIEEDDWKTFWDFEDMGSSRRSRRVPTNMEHLLAEILRLSTNVLPSFARKWGDVAIEWATMCPVRHVACRSLQVLRILAPPLDSEALAELLVRLSNTAADPSPEIQVFALEVLQTLTAAVSTVDLAVSAPQLFWAGVACLETTNDLEFQEALHLLRLIASQADDTVSLAIAAGRPPQFDSTELISTLVIKGFRSAALCHASWLLVRALLSMPNYTEVVDWEHGLPLTYAALIPWGLHNLEIGAPQDHLEEIALALAGYAEGSGREGISRVMTSFAKRRFRTNDDFVRQAVNALREYYLPIEAASLLVLLVGLLYNPLNWLRSKAMAVLKLFIRLTDPTSPDIVELGFDLLTPILNLLQTDVAQQALDILGEPLPVKASSLGRKGAARDDMVGPRIFGIPDDTGWCVADPQGSSLATRRALSDVIDAFATAAPTRRPSIVEFASEWHDEGDNGIETQSQSDVAETNESFGDLVSALHNLSDFFGQDSGSPNSRISSPLTPSNARVAAILSRSLSKRRANRASLHVNTANGPQTRNRPASTFAATVAQHRGSASVDTREDILEEDEDEDDRPPSPTETQGDEEVFDMDDEEYRSSFMRRKSRPPEAHV